MADNREQGRKVCTLHVILHLIILLGAAVGTTYVFVQLASLFGHNTKDSRVEVDVLRQEIHVLSTELSTGLLSLREEFQRDLSDALQRVDIAVAASREVPSNVDDTSQNVKHPTEFYHTTTTGQLDYALESLGGSIVSTRDTKDYAPSPFGSRPRPAHRIIQACVVPGDCWAFEVSGAVVIQLIRKVSITGVCMEHASRDVLPKGAITSAPKDFSVWGLDSLHDEGHYLGNFTYNIDDSPLQYFPIQEASANSFQLIELRIHSNHGNPYYTCLYRFRVHGSMKHHGKAHTSSN
jgi:SUN domain-containing protein 1/2